MTATLREYPVTHCDDRHQATGGPVRVFAVQGQVRVLGPSRSPASGSTEARRPTGAGVRAGSARRRGPANPPGLLASMGAVVAGHATDLWGVVLVTLGVLAALAFYADSLGPAGHDARVGVGDLLGWGRFLVPPVAVAVGRPAADRAPGRRRGRPDRHPSRPGRSSAPP